MSAREMLRTIAAGIDCPCDSTTCDRRDGAASLRALADRIDAEEATARHDDAEATTWQVGAAARARIKLLARLDAALQEEPR